ncbi:MAG: PIG-L family deacetylase [Acidobacteria bacterium]|nr:PIG-L family deacetylase [Acidobacteriota bacterium]
MTTCTSRITLPPSRRLLWQILRSAAYLCLTVACVAQTPKTRLEDLHDKTILVFTPHPDDDVFGAGGTIALLNRHHNKVVIAIYTNDDKGSSDPEMSSQRLAAIRKQEEEASEGLLGTAKENLIWMGYDDGMLEYAAQPKLVEETVAIIRQIRPDVLLSVDPGEWYERWHKTDHRMAAFNTIDAVRAAQFRLYFPNLLLERGLAPYTVPELYFFYPSPQEANYWVNIEPVFDLKADSLLKQVSQFEPAEAKYRPDWDPDTWQKTKKGLQALQETKDGHPVESFRYATSFNDR